MGLLSAARKRTVGSFVLAAGAVLLALASIASAAPTRVAQATTVPEYELKAVFLFNFAQFVDWPPTVFPDASAPIVIGILGADPFGPYLDEVVQGEQVKGRPIIVKRFHTVEDIDGCQILFVNLDKPLSARSEASLAGRGVLTVSDAGVASPTTMIQFVSVRNRLRLRIDAESAGAAGLTISSKLLRAAEIVRKREG